MGLFNRNKKTPEEEYQEQYNNYLAQIEAANYIVRLDFAIGQYGNEDIVAGAMIGSTGKYLMMNKYGDLKWDTTTLAILTDGVEIHYNGAGILYTDILDVQFGETSGFLNVEKQLILVTRQGNYIFKSNNVFIDVVASFIVGNRERYNGWVNDGLISPGENLPPEDWDKLIMGEPLNREKKDNTNNDDTANVDRVLRAAELHERGLLSDEEFMDIKNKFLKQDNTGTNFCPSCGAEIQDGQRFCTNCGHEITSE